MVKDKLRHFAAGLVLTLCLIIVGKYIYDTIIGFLIHSGVMTLPREPESPVRLVITLLSFTVAAGCLLLVYRVYHGLPVKFLFTVKKRFSFKRAFTGFFLWFLFCILMSLVDYALAPETYHFRFDAGRFAALVLISLTLLPIQTTAEELFFRGYLVQMIRSKTNNSLLQVLLPALGFTLLHLGNPEALQSPTSLLVYLFMGLALGYLSVRDKTLELAIGIHFANNFYTCVFVNYEKTALPTDSLFYISEFNAEGSFAGIAVSLILFLGIITWLDRRRKKPVKNIVFDLGRVLLSWNPREIAEDYTDDPELREKLLKGMFHHKDWTSVDHGLLSEEKAVSRFSKRTGLSEENICELLEKARRTLTVKTKTLTELKRLKNKYSVFCLSNMSVETWNWVKENHDFPELFEDVVISAEVGMIKPQSSIYREMISRFDIDPVETIFIDDMEENILAAEKLGIRGIQFSDTESCFKSIRAL